MFLRRQYHSNDLGIFKDPSLHSFTTKYHAIAAAAEQDRVDRGYYDEDEDEENFEGDSYQNEDDVYFG